MVSKKKKKEKKEKKRVLCPSNEICDLRDIEGLFGILFQTHIFTF